MVDMRLLINKKDLALLLERKRDYIGNRVAADTVIAGVSFLLSTLTASYKDIFSISGIIFKYSFCFIGVLYILKIIKDLIRMYTDSYDHSRLMKDIEEDNLDVIVVITLDKITTDIDLLMETYQTIRKHNIQLITANDGKKAMEILDKALVKWQENSN